jgi:hypothetical protein
MTTSKTMTDSRGREIPIEYIDRHDRAKDRIVRAIHREAAALHTRLSAFRTGALARIFGFVRESGDAYDVVIGGEKGNITLRSFDGLIKVQIAVQDNIEFDERLAIAQQLITDYLTEISVGADPGLIELVHKAFYADSQGRLRTGQVLGLRTLAIKHPKWRQAMEVIVESITVQSSKQYVRVYTRPNTDAPWDLIPLNIASA